MTRRWRIADTDWNHWPDGLSDERLWPVVATERVAGIEIGVYSVAEELSAERMAARRQLAHRYDVPVLAVLLSLPAQRWPDGAFTGPPETLVDQVAGAAEVCRNLSLTTLGVWPGADLAGARWSALVDGVRQARDAAARFGVRIALEYKPGTVLPDAGAARRLAADVPGTGVLLDVGHAYAAGEDPAAVVQTLGDLIWHVHLGDATLGGADDDLPLGRVHDVRPVAAALDAAGFTGVAAFDLYGTSRDGGQTGRDAVLESLAHLAGEPLGTRP